MRILSDFERRLEGVIEGFFTKAFRTGVQPVELARRILKDMEAGKTVGVKDLWVPNRYEFGLSEADTEKFAGTEAALRRELEQVVRDGAAERGWSLVGPAEVTFQTDEALKQGQYTCRASLVEGPVTVAPTATDRPTPRPPAGGEDARLILIGRGKERHAIPLTKDRVIIGRLAESDVVVSDPGASRRHAEVRRENGDFVIADLGSTNGTMVNHAAVGERTLQEGDRITIGQTVLEFRRG